MIVESSFYQKWGIVVGEGEDMVGVYVCVWGGGVLKCAWVRGRQMKKAKEMSGSGDTLCLWSEEKEKKRKERKAK